MKVLKNGGIDRANDILKSYLRIFTILIVPSIFGIIGIRNHIYGTLISKDYIAGSNIIIYIAISMFFFGICQLLYKLWQLKEKTINILKLMILSVFLNIVLNIIFIPRYGFIVAAITTLLSNLVTFVLTYFSIRKSYNFKFDYINLIKVLFCSSLMLSIILIMNPRVNSIIHLILVYFITMLLIKVLEPEKKLVINFMQRKKQSN